LRRKLLITGASGFIGRNLHEAFSTGYRVTAPRHRAMCLLYSDAVMSYLERGQFDFVIHSATHNATRNSAVDTAKVLHSNLRMFFNLVRGNQLYGRMIYFGSGAEYGRATMPSKVKEDHFGAHVPTDDYGFSKYISRLAAEQSPNIYNLALFGCFGRYEDWEIRFISNALCKALHGLPVTMRQNVFFDYLYINDFCAIVRRFLEIERPAHRHYNVCTGHAIDLLSLGRMVLDTAGLKTGIQIANSGLGREYSGNNARLLAEIGGFEFTPHRQAIGELADWYRERLSEIRRELLLADK